MVTRCLAATFAGSFASGGQSDWFCLAAVGASSATSLRCGVHAHLAVAGCQYRILAIKGFGLGRSFIIGLDLGLSLTLPSPVLS